MAGGRIWGPVAGATLLTTVAEVLAKIGEQIAWVTDLPWDYIATHASNCG